MSTLKKLIHEYELIKRQEESILESLKNKSKEIIELCPVKVGDVVISNFSPTREMKIKIVNIYFIAENRNRKGASMFRCRGYLIKKDGSLSKRTGDYFC